MTYKFAKHEVHCTIDNSNPQAVADFRKECDAGGIKIIDVQNGATNVSTHVMTSTVCHSRPAAELLLRELRKVASDCGTPLIREKIEVPPNGPDDFVDENSYFEMHVNVRAANLQDVVFDRWKWFVSKNTGKAVVRGLPLWMLTARSYSTTLETFRKSCSGSMNSFRSFIDLDEPVFIEKCIYDTNVELDDHWMNPGV